MGRPPPPPPPGQRRSAENPVKRGLTVTSAMRASLFHPGAKEVCDILGGDRAASNMLTAGLQSPQ